MARSNIAFDPGGSIVIQFQGFCARRTSHSKFRQPHSKAGDQDSRDEDRTPEPPGGGDPAGGDVLGALLVEERLKRGGDVVVGGGCVHTST